MIRELPQEEAAKIFASGPLRPEPRDGRSIVLFETLFKNPADGWAIASRAYARALLSAGVDVRLKDWQRPNMSVPTELASELRGFNAKAPVNWDLHIYSAPLLRYDRMNVLLENLAEYKSAYYSLFERRYVEPELARVMSQLSGVWVSCEMCRSVLAEAGVEYVHHAPMPFFADDPMLKLEPPRQSRTFLYVGRFEPRKSPENIIRAFFRAFRPGEAKLIMKLSPFVWTFSFEIVSPEAVVVYDLVEPEVMKNGWTVHNWRDDIEIVRGNLSLAEMAALHARSDVYVSASRGEGLDLPCFAAKLAGRRMLTTASGGPEDFAGEGDIVVPATGRVEAHSRYDWGPGAWYVDYKLDDLIAAMQTMRASPAPERRPHWPIEKHEASRVGRELKKFLSECAERAKGALDGSG